MGKEQAAEFRCKAEEAETNAIWACDPAVRRRWKEVAGAFRRLAAEAQIEMKDSTAILTYRLTA